MLYLPIREKAAVVYTYMKRQIFEEKSFRWQEGQLIRFTRRLGFSVGKDSTHGKVRENFTQVIEIE